MNLRIYFDNHQDKLPLTYRLKMLVREAIEATLDYEQYGNPCEVSVTFVDNAEIRDLNKKFRSKHTTSFKWHWSILCVSVFLSIADFVYFYSLSVPEAMISIVSMVRRGSVIVSFVFGAIIFHEKNLRSKAVDLALVLLGMIFLYIGSR